MRPIHTMLTLGLAGVVMVAAGCRQDPTVPRVGPPAYTAMHQPQVVKPLPAPQPVAHGPQPFYDEPLLIDTPPEARAFVQVYNQVGRPRVVVFVNRTLEGDLLPVRPALPVAQVEHRRTTTGEVTVERRVYSGGWHGHQDQNDRFQSTGPADYTESTVVYLRPGQYDQIAASQIDYEMMESLLADWMSADNQVDLMSPMLVRPRLTDEQIQDLQSGRPRVLREIAEQLDAEILIHVQARPTRQTPRGLEVRILAEAINLRGGMAGQSIARGSVDMAPPMDKIQLNTYTRFLARKLMDGMTTTWTAPPPPAAVPEPEAEQ